MFSLPEKLVTAEEVFVALYLQQGMENKHPCCQTGACGFRNGSANLETFGLSPNKNWQVKDNMGMWVWSNNAGMR